MVKFLVLIFLGFLIYRAARRYMTFGQKIEQSPGEGPIDEMVQDPSCMTYIPRRGAQRKVVGGKEFFFCSK
ncbi:MAG: TRASH domain protein, partial [Desulfobacteraceae bacterium]|nr:TRASH domain protein [Desulfobacteraceae bacterium]